MTALLARLRAKSIDWIGTSMGGQIGMILAAQPNSPIRRLVLNDIGPFSPQGSAAANVVLRREAPGAVQIACRGRALRARDLCAVRKLSKAEWAHITRHSLHAKGGRYTLAYDPGIVDPLKGMQRADFHIWPLWDRIRCPVLVLRGTESDVLLRSTAQEMQTPRPTRRCSSR